MAMNFASISHLLIDLDGTLVNSLKRLKHVYDDFLSDHQKLGTEEEFTRLKTTSIEKLIQCLKKDHLLETPSHELKKQYESYLEKHYFSAPLFHGAKTFLEQIHSKGVQLILTSACQKRMARRVLFGHKIEKYFEGVYTPPCFDLKVKDATFYQKVIEELQVDLDHALVIDDSLEVIADATKLGLKALLFSKINYHPLPCFGSWRCLNRDWSAYEKSLQS